MAKIMYLDKRFRSGSQAIIRQANEILEEYSAQDFVLTLRQLYYQFVARDLIANRQSEYKRLGSVINDARLAGLIDWDHLEDRTRNLRGVTHWNSPADIIEGAARSFAIDLWTGQEYRPEVWIEKDALVGVIERVCREWDVDYFSCRGYVSQSELHASSMRHVRRDKRGQRTVIIHLGDHDPSGMDMTRDIGSREDLFTGGHGAQQPIVRRIALNMDQVEQYSPPPNPAKLTDSRCGAYMDEFGSNSWELDALEPKVIAELIGAEVRRYCDIDAFDARRDKQEQERELLNDASERWGEVVDLLSD